MSMLCKLIAMTLCGERQVCLHPSFCITWLPCIITCCFNILDLTTVVARCSGGSRISLRQNDALCLMWSSLTPDACALLWLFRVSLCFLVKALLIVAQVGFYFEFGQHGVSSEHFPTCRWVSALVSPGAL